tara:strand:+ start:53 stop:454 length:402 start_codon:yes stop_codon:yes gene_type:complete
MTPKIVKFKKFKDVGGSLIPFYCNSKKNFPFINKRIFLIYGKKNFKRSDHAHKSCQQILFCVSGKVKVLLNKKKVINLSSKKSEGLLIPKLNWSELFFIEKNSILMVFCDQEYDANEYIRDYQSFLKIKKSKS